MGRISTVEEESPHLASKALFDVAEEAARERLKCKTPISHNELLDLIRKANLPPTATRRSSKVGTTDKRIRAWVFGSYVHGPHTGLTNMTKQRAYLSRALARYMTTKSLEPFASIVVADNLVFAPHQDRNPPSSRHPFLG